MTDNNLIDFSVTIFSKTFKVQAKDYYEARHEAVQRYIKTQGKKDPFPPSITFLMSVAQCEKTKKDKLGRPRNG